MIIIKTDSDVHIKNMITVAHDAETAVLILPADSHIKIDGEARESMDKMKLVADVRR